MYHMPSSFTPTNGEGMPMFLPAIMFNGSTVLLEDFMQSPYLPQWQYALRPERLKLENSGHHPSSSSSFGFFTCPACHKQFTRRGNLTRHYKLHSGLRPFRCVECGKSFASKGNLKTHSVVHTKPSKVYCEYCGRSYARQGFLDKHVEKHVQQGDSKQEKYVKEARERMRKFRKSRKDALHRSKQPKQEKEETSDSDNDVEQSPHLLPPKHPKIEASETQNTFKKETPSNLKQLKIVSKLESRGAPSKNFKTSFLPSKINTKHFLKPPRTFSVADYVSPKTVFQLGEEEHRYGVFSSPTSTSSEDLSENDDWVADALQSMQNDSDCPSVTS
eukprot:TRINITY_DN3739_c0_g1_i1.p1 TRINITY_DN3739_c0_g1~~TRINITY_DN3739_c0_g1_i1.p1  ORF type:complete len:331 (+),score=75.32 TRINITY_DN3739_c0_g1_i1:660-1652(+)